MVFKCDCPRCGTKDIGFSSINEIATNRGRDFFAKCGRCEGGIVVRVPGHLGLKNEKRILPGMEVAPELQSTGAPLHTPDNVGRFFEQGMENLPNGWDAAGAMFRKALDTALKSKFPDIKGDLVKRIQKAADNGFLTKDMAEWAHHIRSLGNEAVHDDDPFSEEDARGLHAFTDLVLRYLFTLPGMMMAARQAAKP